MSMSSSPLYSPDQARWLATIEFLRRRGTLLFIPGFRLLGEHLYADRPVAGQPEIPLPPAPDIVNDALRNIAGLSAQPLIPVPEAAASQGGPLYHIARVAHRARRAASDILTATVAECMFPLSFERTHCIEQIVADHVGSMQAPELAAYCSRIVREDDPSSLLPQIRAASMIPEAQLGDSKHDFQDFAVRFPPEARTSLPGMTLH